MPQDFQNNFVFFILETQAVLTKTIDNIVHSIGSHGTLQNTATNENHKINDGSSNCSKLKVSLKNDVLSYQGTYQDIYQISDDLVGGKPSWISGSKAIWYTNNDWLIGHSSYLGDHVADFHVDDTSRNVTDNRNIWQYHNGNSWIIPSDQNDVKVTCLENDIPNENEQQRQNTGLYQKFEENVFSTLQSSHQSAGKKTNCINSR